MCQFVNIAYVRTRYKPKIGVPQGSIHYIEFSTTLSCE